MLSFDEAIRLLGGAVVRLGIETLPLEQAAGRFLAEGLHARSDSPRSAVSAMDGYAVALAETSPGQWLDVVGESRPGATFQGAVSAGKAVRIFTGAALPTGTDCVVMQEYAERDANRVRFREGYGPACHVRAAGSDFLAGDLLVPAGTRLSPRAMVPAAAADVAELRVHKRPRLAIIATGDELAPPGTAHDRPEALPESASFGVAAMAEAMGAEIVLRLRGRDRLEELAPLAEQALAEADCVVVTGGASVGDYDLARPMFAGAGLDLIFSKLAIKPGKPVWLGKAQDRPVLGLPGNPTSAMVTARLFLHPLLSVMQGGSATAELGFCKMPLANNLPETGPRETFVRASARREGLVPVGNQESGAQSPLQAADWLIRQAAGSPACTAGALVDALRF